MWQRWKRLKTGEKVLFGAVGLLILVAIQNYVVMEWIRMSSDKPMYPIRTHYEFAGEGFSRLGVVSHAQLHQLPQGGRQRHEHGPGARRHGSRHDLAYISSFLHDPEANYSGHTVEPWTAPKEAAYVARLPEDELRAIAIFLSQLKADRGAPAVAGPHVEHGVE